jgi:hypothetical protein
MGAPRQFHVATVLGDGRVLVSGGAPAHDGIAVGGELYDPDAATWTAVVHRDSQPLLGTTCDGYLETYVTALGPDSLIARATSDDCSSITMLPAGRLLVAGGTSLSNTARDSTQLTDVASADRLFSQSLQLARRGHTATRLLNGAVLIAGGRDTEARIAHSEIYTFRGCCTRRRGLSWRAAGRVEPSQSGLQAKPIGTVEAAQPLAFRWVLRYLPIETKWETIAGRPFRTF